MTAARAGTFVNVAEPLRDDEIHLWRLAYRREHRRAPLRAVLGGYLGLPAAEVALVAGAHGRPELAPVHDRSLRFNWSHSGGCALVAVARGISPGIDLEQLRPRARALELARRFFTADEAAALAALPEAARSTAFLQQWTAKEAVLKSLGRGIAFGLHRLNVAGAGAPLALTWLDGDDAAAWQLQPLDVDAQHVAALAWRGTPRQLRWHVLEADERRSQRA
jgi:4'-phosphopantetheinyl transferase